MGCRRMGGRPVLAPMARSGSSRWPLVSARSHAYPHVRALAVHALSGRSGLNDVVLAAVTGPHDDRRSVMATAMRAPPCSRPEGDIADARAMNCRCSSATCVSSSVAMS